MAGSVDCDGAGKAMDGDGKGNAVGVGVNDRDSGGLRIDDVNLVTHGIYGHSGRTDPDLEGAILT